MVKVSSNDIVWILLFLYFSFGVEKTNKFIRSCGSLKHHTRVKTIMVKIYSRFQTKTAKKPYPCSLYSQVPPPPPPPHGPVLNMVWIGMFFFFFLFIPKYLIKLPGLFSDSIAFSAPIHFQRAVDLE